MSNDLLYNCANAYKKLMNYEFEVELSVNKDIRKFTLKFDSSQFKHLSGLEKLEDIDEFNDKNSAALLHSIIKKKVTIQDVFRSRFADIKINENSPNNVEYYVVDRIRELANLYDNLHNMTNDNLHIHIWDKDCIAQKRPNHSKIAADYMFEFQNSATKKADTETTCAFFLEIKEKSKNKAIGMSIIPTDISYADDGSISVGRCQILSVNEIDKERNTSVNLISAPEELREKAYSDSLSKAQSITIKQDIKALKSKRKDFSMKKDTKSQTAYQRRMDIFKNKNIYSVDMLNEVLKSLTSQLESQNNKDVGHLIKQEIKTIQNEIIRRETEKNAELPSSITIAKSVRNDNGTISMTKPIVTIETPQSVIKAKSQIEKGTHLADSSIRNIFTDIKESFTKDISKLNKKTPERKPSKDSSAKLKSRAVQSVKSKTPVQVPVQAQEQEKEKVPMFSISELKSDKYAPTSSKDKDIRISKKNDLDL